MVPSKIQFPNQGNGTRENQFRNDLIDRLQRSSALPSILNARTLEERNLLIAEEVIQRLDALHQELNIPVTSYHYSGAPISRDQPQKVLEARARFLLEQVEISKQTEKEHTIDHFEIEGGIRYVVTLSGKKMSIDEFQQHYYGIHLFEEDGIRETKSWDEISRAEQASP